MMFRDIPLHVSWIKGKGFLAPDAPRTPGLYAQIYWPEHAVRIGQSSNIRNRLREATAWANAMHLGTARDSQLRRTSELCERVKATGNEGFEYFLISDCENLAEQSLRLECEAFLFGWFMSFGEPNGWRNWNKEGVRRDLRSIFEEGMIANGQSAQNGKT